MLQGWFYFHTGERLYADFWKGKANGEGRYYSAKGDVFFGHFRDGWRHGKSISIESGVRYNLNHPNIFCFRLSTTLLIVHLIILLSLWIFTRNPFIVKVFQYFSKKQESILVSVTTKFKLVFLYRWCEIWDNGVLTSRSLMEDSEQN